LVTIFGFLEQLVETRFTVPKIDPFVTRHSRAWWKTRLFCAPGVPKDVEFAPHQVSSSIRGPGRRQRFVVSRYFLEDDRSVHGPSSPVQLANTGFGQEAAEGAEENGVHHDGTTSNSLGAQR
jgi:hypothetical protein